MSRPIEVRVDRAALEHNLAVVRRNAPRSRVMAVIKANAYGHGLLRAAQALRSADGFAVLELDAAVQLREAGYRQPILLLEGWFGPEEPPVLEQYRLSAVIHCADQLATLPAFRQRGALEVFLKINTGMNRLGFRPARVGAVVDQLRASPAVASVTLMTHFASADEQGGASEQFERFNALTGAMRLARSLANSAAVLSLPESHADWVRPGIMLYGASPFADRPAATFGLRPAMTLRSRVIAVQELKPRERVGYSGTFEAEANMRVGVVACGYADGYPRHAGTGTPVLVDAMRTRTLGRVSMDMLCVDLTRLPASGVGSEVVLWGAALPVDEVAAAAGTIGYELLCAVAPRVPVIDA
jgi:alanine racemase